MALDIFNRSQAMDKLASQPSALAVPTSFSIRELTGKCREVLLTGWCLPFRPVTDSMKQRMKVEYYPGATEAVAQVFGPNHTDQTVAGVFLTRYMADEDCFLYHEGKSFDITRGGTAPSRVDTAERARDILKSICKAGQEVVVNWGVDPFTSQSRGLVRAANFKIHQAQRIEWEIEFEWVADGLASLTPDLPKLPPDPKSLYDKLNDFINKVQEGINDLGDAYNEYVVQNLRKLNTTLDRVNNLVQSGIGLAGKPAQFAKDVAVTCQNVKQDIVDTQSSMLNVAAQYVAVATEWQALAGGMSFMPWSSTAEKPDDSVDAQTKAVTTSLEASRLLNEALWQAHLISNYAIGQITPAVLDIYTAKTGDTLRKVSFVYYQTPNRWQDIADYNGITSDNLDAGDVLIIPAVV